MNVKPLSSPPQDQQLVIELFRHLHELAHRRMSRERNGHTLQATALVNEAWARFLAAGIAPEQLPPDQFLKLAHKKMDQILIDYARSRNRHKREGSWRRQPLDDYFDRLEKRVSESFQGATVEELLTCLDRLKLLNERRHLVITLRYWDGLSSPEIAALLEVPVTTVENEIRSARRLLHLWLAPQETQS